MINKKPCN